MTIRSQRHSTQMSALASFINLTSTQLGQKLLTSLLCKLHISQIPLLSKLVRSGISYFQPTWLEVCFLFPTSCREVDFENSVQLGQNYFLRFFIWQVIKMPFSSATTGRSILKNCRRCTHKKFSFLGYHLRRIMDKKRFSPAITWKINNHPFKL